MSALKEQLTAAMKDAMRAKEKARLGVFRMALAAIKQIEVDERIEPDDERVLALPPNTVTPTVPIWPRWKKRKSPCSRNSSPNR